MSDLQLWQPNIKGLRTLVTAQAAGTKVIAAATAGKRYRCLRVHLTEDGTAAVELNIEDGTTDLTGPRNFPTSGEWFEEFIGGLMCTKGAALNLVVAGSGTVDGWVEYDEIQERYPSTRVNA